MTPDELWEKYSTQGIGAHTMYRFQFLAALHEYGQAVRDRDAEIADGMELYVAPDISEAISREPLP